MNKFLALLFAVMLIAGISTYETRLGVEQTNITVQPTVKLQDTYVAPTPPTYRERLEYQVSRGEIRAMEMEITSYTASVEECGKDDGIMANGDIVHIGAVAADPSIPFGTRLYIEGVGVVVVKDRGGAIKGNRLDLFTHNRKDAVKWGRQYRKVYFL